MTRPATTFTRPFMPLSELKGCEASVGRTVPEFIARQRSILDERRRQGMTLVVSDGAGRIVRIAPDGTETDITDELDREITRAQGETAPGP